jgi:competence protein ComEA
MLDKLPNLINQFLSMDTRIRLAIIGFAIEILILLVKIIVSKDKTQLVVESANGIETADSNDKIEDRVVEEITVEIAGAVKNPGIYVFKNPVRISDLIKEGGGISSEADEIWISHNINLAEKLTDTSKVYIPFKWEGASNDDVSIIPLIGRTMANSEATVQKNQTQSLPSKNNTQTTSSSSISNSGSVLININKGSSQDIESLPGIGPAYAQRIIQSRPYQDYQDFENRSQIPVKVASSIKNSVVF